MPFESTVRDIMSNMSSSPDFQLIETMRWEPLSGILRLDLHMARLAESATELGFDCDIEGIRQQLTKIGSGDSPLKLRLTLAPDGALTVAASVFQPEPVQTVWRIAVARTRLNSNDKLLRHKTTRRQAYMAAREEYSATEIQEVILLNERDEVCEGTISSIFLNSGKASCATPALSCGLLAGTFRRELLNKGVVSEQIVTLNDLQQAKSILLGNSLRGMIRAELVAL